jgi:hypothetical protein
MIKEVFIEFILEFETIDGEEDVIIQNKLMPLLKYVRKFNVKKYRIMGFKGGKWELIIRTVGY